MLKWKCTSKSRKTHKLLAGKIEIAFVGPTDAPAGMGYDGMRFYGTIKLPGTIGRVMDGNVNGVKKQIEAIVDKWFDKAGLQFEEVDDGR